jgi:hypothetical protein
MPPYANDWAQSGTDKSHSSQSFDDPEEFLLFVPLTDGVAEKLATSSDQSAAPGGLARHGDPSSTTKLEQTFIPQLSQGPVHRVVVDTNHSCEVPSGRQPSPRFDLPFGDVSADLCRHLEIERHRRLLAQAHSEMILGRLVSVR